MHRHSLRLLVAAALALGACAGTPVRKVASLDPSVPAGRVEGQRFTGLRIPLTLSAEGTPWQLATEYPPFLLEQGYEESGLRESDVFAFNPVTKSSLQISFSPADAYTRFDQRALEGLTGFAGTGMESELEEEFGKGKYTMRQGPVTPYRLGGVPYAAKSFTAYESGDVQRENGWIYAFAEPFQMFILYQLNDPDRNADRQDLEKILGTFTYRGWPEAGGR